MLINFISNEYFGLHFCILKSYVPLSLLYTATLKYFSSSQIIRSLTTTAKDKRQKLENSLRATNDNKDEQQIFRYSLKSVNPLNAKTTTANGKNFETLDLQNKVND